MMKPAKPTYRDLEKQLGQASKILAAIQQGQVDVIVEDDRHMQLLNLKKTIDMLRQDERNFRALADADLIGIFEWNLTKDTAFWENDQMYRIFGRSRQLPPLPYSDFLEQAVNFRDKKAFAHAFSKARHPGNVFAFACRIHRPDSRTLSWMEITGKFYQNDADLSLCMIGIVKDISEQKQHEQTIKKINSLLEQRVRDRTAKIQQQTERLREMATKLGQVEQKERNRLAAVLHDHIQPLVVGARMQLWDIYRKNDIGEAHKNAHKIEGVLEETLAELRSLTLDLSPSAILNDGLAGGVNWLVTYMKKKFAFTLKHRVEEPIDPISENICFLLFQCLKELLFNVVKHSGEDQATVSIERTQDQRIKIIVCDNGNGFDPDTFAQIQNDTASLGLFSIEERLKDIGGRMVIASAPGQGTTVTLTAPAGETDEKITTPVPRHKRRKGDKPAVTVRNPEDSIGILIVDDHKLLRQGLVGLLQMEPDFEVVGEAADADTAIVLAENLKPDVVIMDVNLGEKTGMDATRQILLKNPHIKVIALSMHSDKTVINAMYNAGASVFLNKTVASDSLIAQVRGCISDG